MTKETINKTKRQPIEWATISANNVTDKVLISKMYKQFKQLNIKKKKRAEDLKRHFSKDTDGQGAHEKMFNITDY